jgi:hypothetical protein
MRSDTPEIAPAMVLERLVQSVQASVPGLSLRCVVGALRPAQELFPDHVGDGEVKVDPILRLRELGVVVSYKGDDGWGYRGSVSSDPSIDRWAHFATQLLANIQEILVDSSAEAWPQVSPSDGCLMASPNAVVEDGVLHMWFGDRAAPVLTFGPVRLVP